MAMVVVRPERPGDEPAIRAVYERAFGRPQEAALVDALRAAGAHVVSLVAEDDGLVVGHVLFSPVGVEVGNPGLGLGPVGVRPGPAAQRARRSILFSSRTPVLNGSRPAPRRRPSGVHSHRTAVPVRCGGGVRMTSQRPWRAAGSGTFGRTLQAAHASTRSSCRRSRRWSSRPAGSPTSSRSPRASRASTPRSRSSSFVQERMAEGSCARYSVTPGLPAPARSARRALLRRRHGLRPRRRGPRDGGLDRGHRRQPAGPGGARATRCWSSRRPTPPTSRRSGWPAPCRASSRSPRTPTSTSTPRRSRAPPAAGPGPSSCCNPNNPTGTVFSAEQTRRMLARGRARDFVVIADEVYKDFVYGDARIHSAARETWARDRVLRVCSFSKAYAMTGWRVGFLHGPAPLVADVLKVHDALVTCAPVVSQYAALAALELGDAGHRRVPRGVPPPPRPGDRAARRPAARLRLPEAERVLLRVPARQGHGAAGARLAPARRGHPATRARVALVPGRRLRADRRSASAPLLRARAPTTCTAPSTASTTTSPAGPARTTSLPADAHARHPRQACAAARGIALVRHGARAHLARRRPRVVAIAGTQGKTVVKRVAGRAARAGAAACPGQSAVAQHRHRAAARHPRPRARHAPAGCALLAGSRRRCGRPTGRGAGGRHGPRAGGATARRHAGPSRAAPPRHRRGHSADPDLQRGRRSARRSCAARCWCSAARSRRAAAAAAARTIRSWPSWPTGPRGRRASPAATSWTAPRGPPCASQASPWPIGRDVVGASHLRALSVAARVGRLLGVGDPDIGAFLGGDPPAADDRASLTRAGRGTVPQGPTTSNGTDPGGRMALDHQEPGGGGRGVRRQGPAGHHRARPRALRGDLAISFSGAEDVVLVDMAKKIGGRFRVFSLDTGRLHPETYQFLEKVRTHYELPIDTYFPQPEAVQKLVAREGPVLVLQGRPQGVLRRAQGRAAACARSSRSRPGSPASARIRAPARAPRCPVVQLDPTFGSPERPLVKFNPLANWTSKQVWAYIREHDVPYNALHERGFVSIGCEPCTRADQPGRARARRPLVVGRGDHEGMRSPRRQREVSRRGAGG